MSPDASPSPARPPRRPVRRALAIGLGVAVIGGVGLYAGRLVLARQAVDAWLRAQGVEGEVAFRALGPSGLAGALRVGPAGDPDLTAELAEIDYDLTGPWTGKPLGVRVTAIRLTAPQLKARLKDGRISFGRLDPLVRRFSRQPSGGALPDLGLTRGRLALDTEYGRLDLRAEGSLQGGRIARLDLTAAPARLRGADLDLTTGPAELHLVGRDGRLALAGAVTGISGRAGETRLDGGGIHLAGRLPEPDLTGRRLDGPARLDLKASLAGGRLGDRDLKAAELLTVLDGRLAGGVKDLTLTGALRSELRVGEARIGHADVEGLGLAAALDHLTLRRAGGDRLDGRLTLVAQADRARQGDLAGAGLAVRLTGPAALDHYGFNLDLAGRADGRGAWRGAVADPEQRRALSDIRIAADDLRLTATEQTFRLDTPRPIRLATASGGAGRLTRLGPALYAKGGGGFRLDLTGPGLPAGRLVVSRYDLKPDGLVADLDLDAHGDFDILRQADVSTAGRLVLTDGRVSFTARRCLDLKAQRLEFDEEVARDLSGALCPTGGPLFATGPGGWRLAAEARGVAATATSLETRIAQANGPVSARGGGALSLALDLRSATLTDTGAETRFNPVRVSGPVRLAGGVWRAEARIDDPGGRRLGAAILTHKADTGRGGLSLDTGPLAFAPGGLEPSALSPRATLVGRPASGQARFSGRADWGPRGATSSGALSIDRLDFTSPAGPVTGLTGQIAFTSLAPLRAAPGQSLTAERLAVLSGVSQAKVVFGLDRDAIQVETGAFDLAGGKVALEPFEVPFSGGAWTGAVRFEGVELADLVRASPFADRMSLTTRVSGRIPFQVTTEGLRISGGELHAVGPGRITIRREALTGVKGEGGAAIDPQGQAVAADPYSDFVYQAMEDLAFDTLTAQVASRPGGRLGVIFHIKGRHDPPTKAEIRLTPTEVLTRKIRRKLPLPSGAVVDLTLDSSVNLDQLLDDFAEYQRLRGSRPVQP